MVAEKPVESPCIRVCCLDDNNVCIGCYRTLDEITGWRDASEERRREILLRVKKRKQKGRHVTF